MNIILISTNYQYSFNIPHTVHINIYIHILTYIFTYSHIHIFTLYPILLQGELDEPVQRENNNNNNRQTGVAGVAAQVQAHGGAGGRGRASSPSQRSRSHGSRSSGSRGLNPNSSTSPGKNIGYISISDLPPRDSNSNSNSPEAMEAYEAYIRKAEKVPTRDEINYNPTLEKERRALMARKGDAFGKDPFSLKVEHESSLVTYSRSVFDEQLSQDLLRSVSGSTKGKGSLDEGDAGDQFADVVSQALDSIVIAAHSGSGRPTQGQRQGQGQGQKDMKGDKGVMTRGLEEEKHRAIGGGDPSSISYRHPSYAQNDGNNGYNGNNGHNGNDGSNDESNDGNTSIFSYAQGSEWDPMCVARPRASAPTDDSKSKPKSSNSNSNSNENGNPNETENNKDKDKDKDREESTKMGVVENDNTDNADNADKAHVVKGRNRANTTLGRHRDGTKTGPVDLDIGVGVAVGVKMDKVKLSPNAAAVDAATTTATITEITDVIDEENDEGEPSMTIKQGEGAGEGDLGGGSIETASLLSQSIELGGSVQILTDADGSSVSVTKLLEPSLDGFESVQVRRKK